MKSGKRGHWDESNISINSCHGEKQTQISQKLPISKAEQSAPLLLPTLCFQPFALT